MSDDGWIQLPPSGLSIQTLFILDRLLSNDEGDERTRIFGAAVRAAGAFFGRSVSEDGYRCSDPGRVLTGVISQQESFGLNDSYFGQRMSVPSTDEGLLSDGRFKEFCGCSEE